MSHNIVGNYIPKSNLVCQNYSYLIELKVSENHILAANIESEKKSAITIVSALTPVNLNISGK